MHTLVRMPIKLQQPVPPSPVTAAVTARFISIWKYRTFGDRDNNPNHARIGWMISQHLNNERKISLFDTWKSDHLGLEMTFFLSFYILMSICKSPKVPVVALTVVNAQWSGPLRLKTHLCAATLLWIDTNSSKGWADFRLWQGLGLAIDMLKRAMAPLKCRK